MAPRITFVRHAQGYHNLSVENQRIHDPRLTDLGKRQCQTLSRTFPYISEIDLMVASPLKRTIYTALLSFPTWEGQIIGLPEVQESSDEPCDTGSEKAEIEREFEGKVLLDLSLVTDDWNSKRGRWAPERPKLEARALAARKWLLARPEQHIVVVTHGGILHYLTQDWSEYVAAMEYRTYDFDLSSSSEARLVETNESRSRRLGTEKALSTDEDRNAKPEEDRSNSHNEDTLRLAAKVFNSREASRDWVGGFGL